MESTPLYSAEAPQSGLAVRHLVYRDRIEFLLKLPGRTLVIPAAEVRRLLPVAGGFGDILLGTLRGRYPLPALLWGLLLDSGFGHPHLLLHTTAGPVRYYRFAPKDREAFIAACDAMRAASANG